MPSPFGFASWQTGRDDDFQDGLERGIGHGKRGGAGPPDGCHGGHG